MLLLVIKLQAYASFREIMGYLITAVICGPALMLQDLPITGGGHMSVEKEVRFWRGTGMGAVIGAMILVGWLAATYQSTSTFDRDMAEILVIAGFAELIGLTMLGVSRGLQRLNSSPQRRHWSLGAGIAVLGLIGLGWAAPASMQVNPTLLPFAVFSGLVLAGGIAMLGTERLLMHFSPFRREAH
jgi:hypothetical protein